MHFSPPFKCHQHCAASPDGRLIATLSPSAIIIRSTETLQTLHAVKLPSALPGPVSALIWSPSGTKILLSTAEQFQVLSVLDSSFHATVRSPVAGAGTGKPSHIQFGGSDTVVLVFSSFGLKLLIYDLTTSKAVEIGSPKFHQPSSASRGFSIRPGSGHLALLTRVSGRDFVSIHEPSNSKLQRSWNPETLDAQAVVWSPDGQWLLLWDAPVHGWRLFLYTSDGQLVRTLGRTNDPNDEDAKLSLGIRTCQFTPNAQVCALGDYSRNVAIFDTATWRESLALIHPSNISPSDTLQVWQEQLHGPRVDQPLTRSFLRATQEFSPPAPNADSKPTTDAKSGCAAAAFDASANLLATRLDDSPSTVWIWDLAAAELRAVLAFHSPVEISWHPTVRELLLVTCHDETRGNIPFVWDPLSNGPTEIPLHERFDVSKHGGKIRASWISWDKESAALLISDTQHYFLVAVSDMEDGAGYWGSDNATHTVHDSSNLDLISPMNPVDRLSDDGVDASLVDDTFSFKRT